MIKKIQFFIGVLIIVLTGYGVLQYIGSWPASIPAEQEEQASMGSRQDKVSKERPDKRRERTTESGGPKRLPTAYDSRKEARAPVIKNQGQLGTCWAVAASSALESSLLPREHLVFSADHISLKNHFAKSQNDGGDYTMAMAYLAGWQGPVLEDEDPYGDGVSPDGLKPIKHVQEIQIIRDKDYAAIKRAVYEHGCVQSSLYMDLQDTVSSSVYYNQINKSYGYAGSEKSNHDILIVGWDDRYPAEKFNSDIKKDGAFICQNSWGDEFGENGIFYVSYEDSNLGNNCIVYTKVENVGNYRHIYQSDLCGWVGQIGYDSDTCLFANVYRAKRDEKVQAVGFYATGPKTEYELHVVGQFSGEASLAGFQPDQTGRFENAGYYTVELEQPVSVLKGQSFAVVVRIRTPGAKYPVATEYRADEATKDVDISDGEGYISPKGRSWTRTEEEHECNLCLKAYTRKMS